ncbi:thioredoxin family protein [Halorubellus sp. JP-L1]|uniref:thioredoxin family protein n=1 Tax=Halorubellus sp. JP-L1 TaxID=2715753 RepID=UPI00140C6252|nr:thioredoxin family protein [Halorubellus sp. JP-L1]NHN42919.1 thioredoxin family protein [Halorubellus sp. JP-L1]
MRTPLTVESLVDADVLVPAEAGEFSLAPAFRQTVESYRDQCTRRVLDALETRFDRSIDDSSIDSVDDSAARFAAQLCALGDHLEDVSFEQAVSAGFVVNQVVEGPFREDGVPDGFVPIAGRQLGVVEAVCDRAIVYVWRHDCDPCDTMRETLESLLSGFTDDVARFAIYGPDAARYLHDTYDVQGGPATLFVADGGIESRLYGAHYEDVVESELIALAEKPNAKPN